MNISFDQFINLWDRRCIKAFGLNYEDLPDVLCIDDYWHSDIDLQEAKLALDDMEQEMREELQG